MAALPPPADPITQLAVAAAALPPQRRVMAVNGRLVIVIVAADDGRLAPLVAATQPAPSSPADRWAVCKRDVLAVFAASPTPRNLDQLMAALEAVRTPHGRSVLTKALADMTKRDRTLINPGGRGYRLPDWTPPTPPPPPPGTYTPDLFD